MPDILIEIGTKLTLYLTLPIITIYIIYRIVKRNAI